MTVTTELTKVWEKHFKGLSLRQVAEQCGVSHSTLVRVRQKKICNQSTYDKINIWILSKKEKQNKLIKKLSKA